MQISTRASDLRTAIERATGVRADVRLAVGSTRISIPCPPDDAPSWSELLQALRTADRWGSVTADGETVVWAQIEEES
ncbi:hypothetical protein [Streptomyces sp. TLI_171]|uniref:hypothetical protein n=1 Tax=Streptomyces sp. TLI_171 TaxID=1938859 RepID=UPI000C1875DB|nr:hypothetical protein [Streptomyces sp. TLI_171]RKE18498.1 hypothetical protein BX266_1789 [Streptomyces sp. TLI_171]